MPVRKPRGFESCQMIRRVLVRHGTLNIATGALEMEEAGREEVKPCGAPLFGDAERSFGHCRSCSKGFTHPGNMPAEGEAPEVCVFRTAANHAATGRGERWGFNLASGRAAGSGYATREAARDAGIAALSRSTAEA